MTTPAPMVPVEPLPTSHSSGGNTHRLSRPRPAALSLGPDSRVWWKVLVFLLLCPCIIGLCRAFEAGRELTFSLAIMPLFVAGAFAVCGLIAHFGGTRAVFDRANGRLSVTGARHGDGFNCALTELQAVQTCDAGDKFSDGSWHAYQVNLVMRGTVFTRINLLDSGGESDLRAIAAEIAGFTGVPFLEGGLLVQPALPDK